MLLPHPSLSGELSHTLQETDLGICGREQENGCLVALMPDSFHVAKLFAAFCSPTLPFFLSCQHRGENWVALPSFCPLVGPGERGTSSGCTATWLQISSCFFFAQGSEMGGTERREVLPQGKSSSFHNYTGFQFSAISSSVLPAFA